MPHISLITFNTATRLLSPRAGKRKFCLEIIGEAEWAAFVPEKDLTPSAYTIQKDNLCRTRADESPKRYWENWADTKFIPFTIRHSWQLSHSKAYACCTSRSISMLASSQPCSGILLEDSKDLICFLLEARAAFPCWIYVLPTRSNTWSSAASSIPR